jgi:membrane protein
MPQTLPIFAWPRILKELFVETFNEWSAADVFRMGAALAYYALLSLAPLLVLVIRLLSVIWDAEAVRGELVQYLAGFMGKEAAEAVQAMIQNSGQQREGVTASLLGLLTLAWGATSVVVELQSAMDALWKIQEPWGLRTLLKQRSYALVTIIVAGFLFLISMLMSAVVAALTKYVEGRLPVASSLLQSADSLISLLLNTALCAALFKRIPKVSLQWRDVIPGAALTAILLTIGKTAIAFYLGRAGISSLFGAAGSVIVIMVWVYYSAQLFFFGAEFTRVYATRFGSNP